MRGYFKEQKSLTRMQKDAIGLLSIGTFLEYFDLMLYVHMATLLNDLFFPKTDPHTKSLISAAAFCSIFVFRPIGALIFGWLGDNIGRRSTVMVTSFMMAASCFTIAILPTYEQIGITAMVAISVCRILQGLSSMGEVIGAELYVTEITKPPVQYPAVALIPTCSALGGMAAIGMAAIVTSYGLNWRMVFWIGVVIAFVGGIARTALRETPDFVDAKRRLRLNIKKAGYDAKVISKNVITKSKVNVKTIFALFLIGCTWPVCFYFIYGHCVEILKNSFGFSAEQIISHNFVVAVVHLVSFLVLTIVSYYIYPLKILKIKMGIFLVFIVVCPYLLNHIHSPFELMLIQSFVAIFGFSGVPASPIYYKHFPVFKRFTCAGITYALSRATMHIVSSFGMIYVIKYLANLGLLALFIPTSIGFIFSIMHFEKLEKEAGNLR